MKSLLLSQPIWSFRQWFSVGLLLVGFLKISNVTAQWSNSSTTNNLIALAATSDYKNGQQVISDGAGGAIIVWYDDRNGLFNADIFAQRINASGVVQWTTNGVAICNAANEQFSASIVSDGAGGAILSWQDSRTPLNTDIYAQRIDAAGAVQWTADGVAISAASGTQSVPNIVADGAGGAIIAWQDYRNGNVSDIYAQRINSGGSVQWAADGIVVSSETGEQQFPSIVSDNNNGAIITWQDFRSGIADIYAQRLDGLGTVQWPPSGVSICTATSYQYNPVIASDGANGAIITWYDVRNGNQDIFAQRINAAGSIQWPVNGVAVSITPETQTVPAIISDGSGGAIITWQDQRNGSGNNDVFAQKINASGAIQWANNGTAIGNSNARDEYKPKLASDGAGGAIIAWNAYDIPSYSKADIYAQKIDTNGILGGSGGPNPCPSLLTLVSTVDDYSSGTMTKQAAASNGKIEATNLITGSANITYEANSIELKPGFRADNGTVFKAQIGGCGGQ